MNLLKLTATVGVGGGGFMGILGMTSHLFGLWDDASSLNERGQFNYVKELFTSGENTVESLEHYVRQAQQGDFDSAFQAGILYIESNNVNKSGHYLRLAADQGRHASAALILFHVLNRGEYGFGKNETEAFHYLKIAAETNEDAQFFLAELYLIGNGVVEKDLSYAEFYALKSRSQHDTPKKRLLLAKIYYTGTSSEQHLKSISLIREDAEAGLLGAQIMMAESYVDFKGHALSLSNEIRYQEIEKWWSRAAENGDFQSLYRLGQHYERRASQCVGQQERSFLLKAKNAYMQAVKHGVVDAQESLNQILGKI